MENISPPMPLVMGSTTLMAALVATAASKALPPCIKMRTPGMVVGVDQRDHATVRRENFAASRRADVHAFVAGQRELGIVRLVHAKGLRDHAALARPGEWRHRRYGDFLVLHGRVARGRFEHT